MEDSVMKSDEEDLPRTLQPKRGGSNSPRRYGSSDVPSIPTHPHLPKMQALCPKCTQVLYLDAAVSDELS
eukprot:2286182-Amphidinium_carterae.3